MNLSMVLAVQKLTNFGLPSDIISKILDYNIAVISVGELESLLHYKNYAIK